MVGWRTPRGGLTINAQGRTDGADLHLALNAEQVHGGQMRVRSTVVTLTSAVLLLAGCGASQPAAPATVTAQVPVTVTQSVVGDPPDTRSPSASSPTSQATTNTPPASTAAAVPLGSSQTYEDITMTVHAVDRNAPPETSLEDKPRTAVDIEACAHGPNVAVSGIRWALQDVNGGRYTPDSFTINPVLPEYPTDRGVQVLDGECFRGWLVMEVPPAAQLTTVRYTPVDPATNQPLATLFWSIPSS